jgi:adenylate cyclase
MGIEIERKFLLAGDGWRRLATREVTIRQAYVASTGKASVRVRIRDNDIATLTIKSRPHGLRRLELEYAIPILDAEDLLKLRSGAMIEKVRHIVPWGDLVWDVDVFSGENTGLAIAEIELQNERQEVELPAWIGAEITGHSRYYNSSLAEHPFCRWAAIAMGSAGLAETPSRIGEFG